MLGPMLLLTLLLAQAPPAPSDAEAPPGDAVTAPTFGLVLQNATLLDADGEQQTDLLIHDGVIHAIGPDLVGAETLDLEGAIVTPGLIDGHVHTTVMPGQPLAEREWDALRAQAMRAYVAAGVTTVLDAVAYPTELEAVRALEVRPDIQALGSPPILADSYGTAVLADLPVITDVESLRQHLRVESRRDVVGLKVLQEHGLIRDTWPVLDGELAEVLVEEAAVQDLPLYVHAMSGEEVLEAMELEPHALMHTPLRPAPDAAAAMVEADVWVVSTLNISVSGLIEFTGLDDPLARLLVPEELRVATQDPTLQQASRIAQGDVALPGAPAFLFRRPVDEKVFHRVANAHIESVRLLHQAGVKLVMGSDAPGWPVILNGVHGYSTIMELEHLEAAGLSPLEVLQASTANGADMMGLDDRGRIREGLRADLVVHGQDPRQSTGAWRELRYVIKAGELRTPAEWLAD